jgi:F-type H+-transporting ATPase subunit epsilon
MSFKLVVISPEKKVLETEIISVTIPAAEGEITVLPKHMSIFSTVKPGVVIARTKDGEISLAAGGGFVNVTGDTVTLLLEYGVKSDEMDEAKILEAKRRAEEVLKNQTDEKASALAQASLARSLLELKVVNKKRAKN